MVSKKEKERSVTFGAEILKLAGCLDDVDKDVAELCLKVMPKDGHLISLADFMKETQKMKNKLSKSLSKTTYDKKGHTSHNSSLKK